MIHHLRYPRNSKLCQLWVTSIVLCDKRPRVDFGHVWLATELASRCNVSRRAISRHGSQRAVQIQ